MIHPHLFEPKSIAVIGASENSTKPGGKVLLNLVHGNFAGQIYAVNKNPVQIPGTLSITDIEQLPQVDLAIVSIPAASCISAVETLVRKGTRAFIVYSAGFSEAGAAGKALEEQLLRIIKDAGATLIGSNCIGIINGHYKGVFTSPIPEYYADGCELISSSGATAVFIMEAAHSTGLHFSNIYSIGNAIHTGVEELLEYMDEHFDDESPKVKLLYLEHIRNPFKFMKHASSLIRKGCRIAAIKAGYSEAGSRAASSHTGAMASSDIAIRALFKKCGVVYCSGRDELITVGCIFQSTPLEGNRIAIITHAGGSAVMLTDALTTHGLTVPKIDEQASASLLSKLHPGSSVANPIDFLATGTAAQLNDIITFCEGYDGIDAMIIVFGSPGLFNSVQDVYDTIDRRMSDCKKPIYPVLPSLINAKKEIEIFLSHDHVNFPDEVVLGKALPHVYFSPDPTFGMTQLMPMETATIRNLISESENGYLNPKDTYELMEAAGIRMAKQGICSREEQVMQKIAEIPFPWVMKVIGPVHKTEVGGVSLNILNAEAALQEFRRMKQMDGVTGILIQEMLHGEELYCGAVKQGKFGQLVLCGPGGIFLEVMNDIAYGLAPLNQQEATHMIQSLRGYEIIRGYRGRPGVNETLFTETLMRLASLVHLAPEIAEIDINPLLGNQHQLVAVDARVRIEK